MKTKLLLGLLLVANILIGQATNDDLRLNLSIGTFSAGGAGDFTGAVGTVGSTGFVIDSVKLGDVLVDDLHSRYEVAGITIIVQGSSATLELTCLDNPCAAPQSGKGLLFRPTSNLGLELLTENGSNFITEGLEAKVLTHNFLEIDRQLGELAGDNLFISRQPDDVSTGFASSSDYSEGYYNYNFFGLADLRGIKVLGNDSTQMAGLAFSDFTNQVDLTLFAKSSALVPEEDDFENQIRVRKAELEFMHRYKTDSTGNSNWSNGIKIDQVNKAVRIVNSRPDEVFGAYNLATDSLPLTGDGTQYAMFWQRRDSGYFKPILENHVLFPNFSNTSANTGFFKNSLGRLGFQHGNTGGSSGVFSVNGLGGISRMTLYSTTDSLNEDYSSVVIEPTIMTLGTFNQGTDGAYFASTINNPKVGGVNAGVSFEYNLPNSDPPSDGNEYIPSWTNNGNPTWVLKPNVNLFASSSMSDSDLDISGTFGTTSSIQQWTNTATITGGSLVDITFTMPTPSVFYNGKTIKVVGRNTNGVQNILATAGANTLVDAAAIVTSITISNWETVIFTCTEDDTTGTYYWVSDR